ncbi:hypothetical protein BJ546DRAFT_176137 [Cryomyces antarcticus]
MTKHSEFLRILLPRGRVMHKLKTKARKLVLVGSVSWSCAALRGPFCISMMSSDPPRSSSPSPWTKVEYLDRARPVRPEGEALRRGRGRGQATSTPLGRLTARGNSRPTKCRADPDSRERSAPISISPVVEAGRMSPYITRWFAITTVIYTTVSCLSYIFLRLSSHHPCSSQVARGFTIRHILLPPQIPVRVYHGPSHSESCSTRSA